MFKQLRNLYFIFAAVLLVGQASYALSTYYLHLTNHETTRFDEIIWFWTPDTMDGPVHSNDFIGLKYSPHFYEHVSTSQDHFLEYQPNPYFEFEPIFNAPRIEFPESFNHLRNNAHPLISSRNDLLMTWISMDGADGIDIFQYPMGTLRNDSLCMHLNVPHRQIIFVDGEVEVEGELAGQLTICSRGDMWLIDNCIYTGAHRQTGWFEENHMNHMLGLVSERNIIIEGNERNGLRNGWEENRGDHDRHSIVINGHLIALGESFTFEHQNDEWERYQGPTPDRRGYIYLKGSLAQYRRGYVHRANHGGTGYGKSYHWDSRLRRLGPPGFGPGENPAIQGRYDVLELGHISGYYILNASVGTLIIHSGVDVELRGNNPIVVRDRLIIRGSAEHPVTIHPRSPGARTTFRVERGSHSYVEMYYAHFAASIETRITCDTLLVSNPNPAIRL